MESIHEEQDGLLNHYVTTTVYLYFVLCMHTVVHKISRQLKSNESPLFPRCTQNYLGANT
jgi:hypothetical protein